MNTLPPAVRVSQLLVVAMILGLASFAGVVVFLLTSGMAPATTPTLALSYLAPAVWLTSAACSMFVPGIILKSNAARNRGQGDSWLPAVFQQATIVRAALLEGGALLCVVAVLVERQWPLLALTAASVLVMAATFPTLARYEDARRKHCS